MTDINMNNKEKTLVIAGATGYLGRFLVKAAKEKGYRIRALVRSEASPDSERSRFITEPDEIFIGKATDPSSLRGLCENAAGVISSLGITRQKDGFTYHDVDFQGNQNILEEAVRSNVGKFAYVSVFNGDKITNTKLGKAKEDFVRSLKSADIKSLIIRPTGFFSDMRDFFDMASRGKVYLFGKGDLKINPIHGSDLAREIMKAWERDDKELPIGGPDTFTFKELGQLAIDVSTKASSIVLIPDVFRRITLRLLTTFTREKFYGPIEFFLTAMAYPAAAPEYGTEKLEDFYKAIARGDSSAVE